MSTIEMEEIYYGARDDSFKSMLFNVLKQGNLKAKYVDVLLSEENLNEYSKAFTAKTANEYDNLEVYEQLGDVTANKFIVWYMYKRFPKLRCPEGVKIVARLRINYGAKQSFFQIAQSLGFWDFISASATQRGREMKALLEDTFEAFIGVTEFLLDSHFGIDGVGNSIVSNILTSIFDDMFISIDYEDLYDAKTRLKELFDYYGSDKLGVLHYEETRDTVVNSCVYRIVNGTGKNKKQNGTKIMIGKGYGNLKSLAQQKAAADALEFLKTKNIQKSNPDYGKFY